MSLLRRTEPAPMIPIVFKPLAGEPTMEAMLGSGEEMRFEREGNLVLLIKRDRKGTIVISEEQPMVLIRPDLIRELAKRLGMRD